MLRKQLEALKRIANTFFESHNIDLEEKKSSAFKRSQERIKRGAETVFSEIITEKTHPFDELLTKKKGGKPKAIDYLKEEEKPESFRRY